MAAFASQVWWLLAVALLQGYAFAWVGHFLFEHKVFLIQNTQNRDTEAIQVKLDELIRSADGARNHLLDLEALSDEDLDKFQKEFERLRKRSERTAATVEKVGRKLNSH